MVSSLKSVSLCHVKISFFLFQNITLSSHSCSSIEQELRKHNSDSSTSRSYDSDEGCDTIRMYLSPHGRVQDEGETSESSDAEEARNASSESSPASYASSAPSSNGDLTNSEDSAGPGGSDGDHGNSDNSGDDEEMPNHDEVNDNGGGLGPGRGGDPEDPDDPDGDADEEAEASDSDPDGDMPDGVDTFSFQNPALDAPIVMNHEGVTRRELLAMIIALSVRSRLDYETLTKIFSIINLPLGLHQMPETKKNIWASIGRNWFSIKKHAYCLQCLHYFGLRDNLERFVVCEICGRRIRRGNVDFFVTLNVRNQLKSLLNEPGAWNKLSYPQRRVKTNPEAIEDILDGEAYQRIPKGQYDFTYQFNLDPFSTSKSSNTEVCPIFMKINELPPNLRQKHVILAGLWLGPKNIDYNLFMKVFRKQCNKLSEIGITWRPDPNGEEQVSRFYCTCGVCDAVGRAGVLNLHTHAGRHSCPYCEHPAIRLEGAMKFPLPGTLVERMRIIRGAEVLEEVLIPEVIDLRTDASIRRDMVLEDPRQTGFKGPSEVALINHFNLSFGFSTDDLHPLYIGVTQFHTELLLAGVPGDFRVTKRQKKTISCRLKSIKTPTHISRKTRGIDTIAKWKGSEWRNWLLFYAVLCLDGIVPDQYLRHFGLLSEAVFILSRDSITEEDLAEAHRLITEYVQEFQQFFGPESMRYNIHILTHLVQCVRLWGPLWAISTMPYESWNFRLHKCVSSPKGVLDQICMRYLMVVLVRGIPFSMHISDEVKQLVAFIQDGKPTEYNQVDGANFFGEPSVRAPTNAEMLLLHEQNYECDCLTIYPQVKVNSFDCRSTAYRDDIKSLNSVIYTNDDTFHSVESIVVFRNGEGLVGGMFTHVIEVNPEECLHDVPHIVPIIDENERRFIRIQTVRNLAIKMNVNEMWYVTPMSNQKEID